jgi:synaptobrevin family protein YKT6
MKVFSIILFSSVGDQPVILTQAQDLSQFGFWKRGTVREILTFVSRQLISRTNAGQRQSVFHELKEPVDGVDKFLMHGALNSKKVGYVVVTDGEYQQRVAYAFGDKMVEALEKENGDKVYAAYTTDQTTMKLTGLEEQLAKYQSPTEVDAMSKIMKDLDETRDIMVENIDKLLARGEKIEDLVDRTNDLSESSKIFVKRSKDLNRCCIII